MIRCRLRKSKLFQKSTYEPIKLENGVTALIGKQLGQDNLKIQTLMFNTNADRGRVWDLRMAKSWVKEHKQSLKEKVYFDDILQKAKEILIQENVYKMPSRLEKSQLEKSVARLQRHFGGQVVKLPIKKSRSKGAK
jgi:hypothetical protein